MAILRGRSLYSKGLTLTVRNQKMEVNAIKGEGKCILSSNIRWVECNHYIVNRKSD